MHSVERVIISHWHADHSGGLLSFLKYRNEHQSNYGQQGGSVAVVADLHPNRPIARGIAPPPTFTKVICRLPEDPTFEDIRTLGGIVELHDEPHVVAGDTVYISGEIPRVTEFERGLLGSVRWTETELGPNWVPEPVYALRQLLLFFC